MCIRDSDIVGIGRRWPTAPGRGDWSVRRRGVRLPRARHPFSGGANRLLTTGPVRGSHPASPPGKITAEVHDYRDIATGVLASSLAKRTPGSVSYTHLRAHETVLDL